MNDLAKSYKRRKYINKLSLMETGYIKFSDVEADKPIIEVKIFDGTV